MLDEKVLQEIAFRNEEVAKKRLKKMGLRVERLDHQGPRKRPEFLVLDSTGPMLICEVKTIFSAGFLGDRSAHISTHDPALLDTEEFSREISFQKMEENLDAAVGKFRTLVEDRPELAGIPLVVIFFFDFFANDFDFFHRDMPKFPDISGIMRVEVDHEIRRASEKLSLEGLRRQIESRSKKGMPPPSKGFRLVVNTSAKHPLPGHFVDSCIT